MDAAGPCADLESFLTGSAAEIAPRLLGAVLTGRGAALRLTEVEAYLGVGEDPASHANRGRTPRTASMFGPPARLYCYFSYGMHVCANVVVHPVGEAGAVLLRAGEVVDGLEFARARRRTSRSDADLASGPARLTLALGIELADDGTSLIDGPIRLELPAARPDQGLVREGPRTGVSGDGGSERYPLRFWFDGDPTVSPSRRHTPRGRAG